jgi:hypothetical protein
MQVKRRRKRQSTGVADTTFANEIDALLPDME